MKKNSFTIQFVFVGLTLLLPFILSTYGLKLTTEVLITAIFVMSLGLIIGYAGMVSLGHAAFYGLGAYCIALIGPYISNSAVLLLLSAVIAGLAALLSGLLFIRSSGAYFLMITLAFGQMLYAIFYKASVTGGADGKSISTSFELGFGPIDSRLSFYYVAAICFFVCYFLLRILIVSPFGKSVRGIKENEHRMTALGFNTQYYKLIVYTLSGMMAGFAGGLYAYFNSFVSPDLFHWMFSGQALIMVIVGGVGTLIGPAAGAGLFVVLQNYISSYTDRWPIVMGLIFVSIVLYGRGGMVHILSLLWEKLRPGQKKSAQNEELSKEGNVLESANG